jgi:hypothetical protein
MALRTFLLASLFLTILPVAFAQDSEKKPQQKAKPTAVKSEEADAMEAQRKVVAISLLTSLADDARSFRDLALRARIEARAADAFWETDEEKARQLFYRAWEEASNADAEAARRQNEELRRQQQAGGPMMMRRPRDLRSEVLRLAAKRDTKLGEEFLKKLAEAEELAKKDAVDSRFDPASAPIEAAKRLQLAQRLLDDGLIERAMQFASPALGSVNRESINFLSSLREKNADAADQAFLALLGRAQQDPNSDANTVSGLSSYAFTPFLYITFSKEGNVSMSQSRDDQPAPQLSATVSKAFFRVASDILLRPLAPPDQDRTTSGRVGKYMVIRRLLPLFEQYAAEQTQVLKTQMAALAGDVPQDERTGESRAVNRGIVPEDVSTNPLERMQERLDRARTTEERDSIYADYAVALAGKGDPRARELVDKIENSELRKSVRGYIDFQATQQAIADGNAAEVSRLAKSGELTSPQRIFANARAARLWLKTDPTRAVEVLDEALAEARRISGSSPDRAKGFFAVATLLMEADRVRAWEVVSEGLKAANAAEGFTGEDSTIISMVRSAQMTVINNSSAEEFDLLGLFRSLAKDDLNRAVELAKGFTGEGPRAVATLAIARAILEKPANEPTAME